MATTSLESLTKIASAKLNLKNKANRLVEAERRAIDEVGRLLSSIGYDLVPISAPEAGKRPAGRRKRALAKILKCPKCDRRFSLQMHVGRHLKAKHGVRAARKGARRATKKRA